MIPRDLLPRLPRTPTTLTLTPHRHLASARPRRTRPLRLTPKPHRQPSSSPSPNSDAPIHATTQKTVRRIMLTGGVALITVVGAVTGASLKADRDVIQQRQEVRELSPAERIAMLETRRGELVGMKMPLERKLATLRERVEAEKLVAEQEAEG